jgi:hypothetical protein
VRRERQCCLDATRERNLANRRTWCLRGGASRGRQAVNPVESPGFYVHSKGDSSCRQTEDDWLVSRYMQNAEYDNLGGKVGFVCTLAPGRLVPCSPRDLSLKRFTLNQIAPSPSLLPSFAGLSFASPRAKGRSLQQIG